MDLQQAKADLREHYATVRAALMAAIDGLTDEQLSEESLEGWSVKDHLAHLALWDEVRRLEIERIADGGSSAWPVMDDADIHVLNELTVRLRRGWSPAQALAELRWSRQRVIETIENAGERAFDESLYGESGLRSSHDIGHAEQIRAWRSDRGY